MPPAHTDVDIDAESQYMRNELGNTHGRVPLNEQDYTVVLMEERYLEGQDIRFVEQWDDEKFVAGVWGKSELCVFDREKPDLVHTFCSQNGSQ